MSSKLKITISILVLFIITSVTFAIYKTYSRLKIYEKKRECATTIVYNWIEKQSRYPETYQPILFNEFEIKNFEPDNDVDVAINENYLINHSFTIKTNNGKRTKITAHFSIDKHLIIKCIKEEAEEKTPCDSTIYKFLLAIGNEKVIKSLHKKKTVEDVIIEVILKNEGNYKDQTYLYSDEQLQKSIKSLMELKSN